MLPHLQSKAQQTSYECIYEQNSNIEFITLLWPCTRLYQYQYTKSPRGDKGKDKKEPKLFQGQFTLTIDRAREGTKYKYVIIKKKVVLWEELIEFQPRYGGAIVDRFLSIPEKYLERGGKLLLLFRSTYS